MRPPSYYASLASSNSRTSAPSGSSRSSSQLRSSLAAPSSASYVTRTHLPYVSQSVLMAHCITGPGSTTKPYGQSMASSAHSAASSYMAAAPRAKSLKRYTPSTSMNSTGGSPYLTSSSSASSYTPNTSRTSYYSSSSSSSYRPTNNYTASSYYKPIRLRERPLLTQLNSSRATAASATAKDTSNRAESRKEDDSGWSADVGRNISRNKYLIKFREVDKRAPPEPLQLRNRQEVEPSKRIEELPRPIESPIAQERLEEHIAPLAISCDTVVAAEVEVQQLATNTKDSPQAEKELDKTEALATSVNPKAKRLVKPKVRRQSNAAESGHKVPEQTEEEPRSTPPASEVAPAAPAEAATPSSPQVDSSNNKRIRFRQYSLDDFNLLTVLGHGGWGFVMLAELKEHDACFAVKCIKKITIVEDDDFDSIMIERKVLSLGNLHPFICKLFCTFETQGYLFFVMEFCAGGDLMFHVQREGKFAEPRCRFYAAEIICAIRFLHNRHIIYRDLKLDNILLDSRGHVRLVDFGMCQCRTYREEMLPSNFCGTPEYISPEIIKGVPYNHSVDWWSFGVLLYEMAVGKMPFRGSDENELLWNVCYEQIHYPMFLSKELAQLLQSLLEREPLKRMGMASCKAGDIYNQPWFRGLDWQAVEELRVEPPFVPQVDSKRDVQNFDTDFTESACELSPVDAQTLSRIDQNQFQKFPYTNPDIFIFNSV